MNKEIFTRPDMMAALKRAGLPFSRPSFLKYESMGILKAGANSLVYPDRIWRLYTAEEILANVERLENWLKQNNKDSGGETV